uniref:Ribosomal protein L20 n=1 Tax=Corallina chilensis TaxID=2582857 RepID=A0A4P8VUT4_9FLOR|nr:ribosomal protein L20 [Corallina chilensis]QCS25463.1 ribosomal protein L20 [Corallina chilensis]
MKIMRYSSIKHEKTSTISRYNQKNVLSQSCINTINSYFSSTNLNYSLLSYFLNNNSIFLNQKTLSKLILEEKAISFIISKWLIKYYHKNY